MSEEANKSLVVVIDGHRYDVANFDHPGDGIKDLYLRNFGGRDVSAEFDQEHFTDEPYEMLQEAHKNGEYEGIKYLGAVEKK
jgi:cytochrome b involved in lipid metabolism